MLRLHERSCITTLRSSLGVIILSLLTLLPYVDFTAFDSLEIRDMVDNVEFGRSCKVLRFSGMGSCSHGEKACSISDLTSVESASLGVTDLDPKEPRESRPKTMQMTSHCCIKLQSSCIQHDLMFNEDGDRRECM